jgi:hypothetical protein
MTVMREQEPSRCSHSQGSNKFEFSVNRSCLLQVPTLYPCKHRQKFSSRHTINICNDAEIVKSVFIPRCRCKSRHDKACSYYEFPVAEVSCRSVPKFFAIANPALIAKVHADPPLITYNYTWAMAQSIYFLSGFEETPSIARLLQRECSEWNQEE